MESIDINAAISVEEFTLNDNKINNYSMITSIKSYKPTTMVSLAKLITVMLVCDKVQQDKIVLTLTLAPVSYTHLTLPTTILV